MSKSTMEMTISNCFPRWCLPISTIRFLAGRHQHDIKSEKSAHLYCHNVRCRRSCGQRIRPHGGHLRRPSPDQLFCITEYPCNFDVRRTLYFHSLGHKILQACVSFHFLSFVHGSRLECIALYWAPRMSVVSLAPVCRGVPCTLWCCGISGQLCPFSTGIM